MSIELPYLKFFPNEWLTGDITLEDYDVQGLFVNLIAYYWSKEGNVTLTNAKRKYKGVEGLFESLIDSEIIKVDRHDKLIINFLDEQLNAKEIKAKNSRENGKKGGRPPGSKKPSENPKETQRKPSEEISETENNPGHNPKEPNLEKIREEKIREDVVEKKENLNSTTTAEKKENFLAIPTPFGHYESLEDMEKVLLSPTKWQDDFAMSAGLKPDQIPVYISEFFKHLKATGNENRQLPECKRHLLAWTRKQIEKGNTFEKIGNQSVNSQPPAKESSLARLTRLKNKQNARNGEQR